MLNTVFGLISFTSRKPTFKKGYSLVSGIAGFTREFQRFLTSCGATYFQGKHAIS